jgi:hypothetical protein
MSDQFALALIDALANAARDCATEIGLPVALEDDAVHALLRATGHNPNAAARQRLGIAAGMHTFPVGQWSYHASDLRMFCTAPVDPRPQAAWDDILWLSPRNLLARANGKDAQ